MENKEKQTVHEEALAKLLEYSYREDTPLMMKNDNGFFGLYFDMRTKGLSDFKYTRLWYAINQVIRADNKNWMYRYWEFADQYYGSIFAYEVNDKEAVKFFEFHVAVGGLLALNGKYEWVDHIAWFTNCLPPKYFLVPSTFSEIFNWLVYFAKMSESSVDLDVKYHLYSQYDGVRAGANLYKGIVKYLALMMCRLPKIDFNVRYVESMALPHVYGSSDNEKNFISVNEKNIRTVKFLKQVVSELDNQPNTAKEKAMKLLEEYIVACENMISYRMSNTDNEKLNHIKSTLLSEFDRQIKILIMRKDSELKSFVKQSWFAESIDALDGFDFLEGSNYNNINRESVMIR